MSEDWAHLLADELHKPVKRNFPKRRVFSQGIDKIWAADLVEMGKFSEWNEGVKYLLMVIDVFSKFGWIEPLKNKKGETVANAFKKIFKKRKPEMLWVDKGKEFWNANVKDLLEKNGVKLYSTENEEKSSVVERWNRTMKEKMWKMFSARNETVYHDRLDELVDEYNRRIHSSIGMSPIEASKKKNENKVFASLYGNMLYSNLEKPKFKKGEKVRITKYKRKTFDKGYTPNWTEEMFVVDKVLKTDPVTYKLVDLMGEELKGSFYEKELAKAKQEIFRIEEVLDEEDGEAFVKWKGYPEKFNSWIPLEDVQKI